MDLPKRKLVFQPSISSGYVSFREGISFNSWSLFLGPEIPNPYGSFPVFPEGFPQNGSCERATKHGSKPRWEQPSDSEGQRQETPKHLETTKVEKSWKTWGWLVGDGDFFLPFFLAGRFWSPQSYFPGLKKNTWILEVFGPQKHT